MFKNSQIGTIFQVFFDLGLRIPVAKEHAWRTLLCVLVGFSGIGSSWGRAEEPEILGEWRMDERVRHSPGIVYNERDLRIFVIDQNDDGTYRVISTVTIHVVAEREDMLFGIETYYL